MRRTVCFLIIIFLLCNFGLAQAKRGPSTQEERDRAVRIAEQLEANPIPSDKSDREWVFRWLVEVPDISVSVCTGTMPWEKKYEFAGDLMIVQMASSAAFVIKNPEKASDSHAVSLAGFESSLRAYEKLVAANPKARSKRMDEMLAKRADASLTAYMTEKIKKECK